MKGDLHPKEVSIKVERLFGQGDTFSLQGAILVHINYEMSGCLDAATSYTFFNNEW